jgi:hypothetical protein
MDQPMLAIDPPRPETGQIAAQRFGLADAVGGVAPAVRDEPADLPGHRPVGFRPVTVAGPGAARDGDDHASGGMPGLITRPASSSAIAARRAERFAGDASRQADPSMLARSSRLTITTGFPPARVTSTGS